MEVSFRERTFRNLEVDKILSRLQGYCSSEGAKKLAATLNTLETDYEINKSLTETDAAIALSVKHGLPSFYGIFNPEQFILRTERGGSLSMAELLSVAVFLATVRNVKSYKGSDSTETDSCLDGYFFALHPNRTFEEKITTCIISESEMADNASAELSQIRRKIVIAQSRIRDTLNSFITSPTKSKFLRENIITQRSGRFVIPVKAENKKDVSGLVHDVSSTGATYFIEPAQVVEANNEISELMLQEKKEIARILATFSAEFFEHAADMRDNYTNLTSLDFIFGRSQLALSMDAFAPVINRDGIYNLKKARHPLIASEKIVPINISVGEGYDTLIITGPNTGGKTVAIKTLGLLSLMAAMGLHIPVESGSVVSVGTEVYADIGDEQSIEQNLSTFSAHMKNIVYILDHVQKNDLVLFDEIGAGTDPTEGAALAIAVIARTRELGARTVATTHYAELKQYALNETGVVNGCCEFDVETLRPTYRLMIGIPGKSNAFAISEKLGLARDVIENARGMINKDALAFEEMIGRLQDEKVKAEQERLKAEKLRKEIETLSNEAKTQQRKFNEERARYTAEARKEAQEIIDDARREAHAVVDELVRLKKTLESTANVNTNAAYTESNRKLNELENKLRQAASADAEQPFINITGYKPKVGDEVSVPKIRGEGKVIELNKDGTVTVQAGILKLKLQANEIELIAKSAKKKPAMQVVIASSGIATAEAANRCDMRGMNTDEALMELDSFINRAMMQHMPSATLIHGKGSGILRKAVQNALKQNPHIKSFRNGEYGEGDSGVTIVEFK